MTIIARGDGSWTGAMETERLAFNTSLRNNHAFADGFVDLANDTRLQTPSNTTYYSGDQLHLVDAGYAVVASLMQPVMMPLAKPDRKPRTDIEQARDERRRLALSSPIEFISLVQPKRWLGSIHREILQWWDSTEAKNHLLLLLPRDHMKSALAALLVVLELTRDPTLKVLYISSTSNLATKQLKFMKDILTSDVYRMYWA